jgi:hypothetical protein
VQIRGGLTSQTSAFSGVGVNAHVSWPLTIWGESQDPRLLGLYAGGEAQLLTAIQRPPAAGEQAEQPPFYGTLAAEGGVELSVGAQRPAGSPFPTSLAGPSPPRWSFRLGYIHLFAGGLNSGGYTTTLRLAW